MCGRGIRVLAARALSGQELRGATQGQEGHRGWEPCTWFSHNGQKGSFLPSSFSTSLLSSIYPFDRWKTGAQSWRGNFGSSARWWQRVCICTGGVGGLLAQFLGFPEWQ